MEKYSELSKRYLKYQKNRTLLTILGVALAAGALFVILTLYFSNFINKRDKIRKETNYDMVVFNCDESDVAEIVQQDYVKSAYLGTYYNYYSNVNFDDALFINFKNPYKMDKYYWQIIDGYECDGELNESLASYYLQGDIGNVNFIILLMFLFLAVVFAIIGVGIIRNSIQLNTLEQVKDYGILRCVGATEKQLKSVIFLMGFYQEIAGIVLGFVIGYPVAMIFGAINHIKVGIHVIPVAFVLVAFLGDLYFVMSENAKIVKKLTPVEAVRGNFSVKKKKIRRRRKSIFGLIFGLEGDYAYKSLKANKGRYYKSVFAFGLGIAFFIGIAVFSHTANIMQASFERRFGNHPLYFYDNYMMEYTYDDIQNNLPSYGLLQQIAEHDNVTGAQTMYTAFANVVDKDEFISKYNEKFLNETYYGEIFKELNKRENESAQYLASRIQLMGYDTEEYAQFEDLLLEGTLNVGDDGILIAKQCLAYPMLSEEEEESGMINIENIYGNWYDCNDYELGDTITFYDMERTGELYQQYIKEAGLDDAGQYLYDEYGEPLYDKKEMERRQAIEDECIVKAYKQADKEGAYKTYTVKGIVQRDLDIFADTIMQAIVPLDTFQAITGLKKGQSTGVKYSLRKLEVDERLDRILTNCLDSMRCYQSDFIFDVQATSQIMKTMRYMSLFIIFVVIMSSLNIINTSASNLHLRRQELAQLRVVGVSKKRLTYIVVLEGVITSFSANVLGNLLGYAFIIPMRSAVNIIMQIPLRGTLTASIVGLIVSTLILCGSIYLPIRKMGNAVVEDLNASGD